jgi:predicted acyltransferase
MHLDISSPNFSLAARQAEKPIEATGRLVSLDLFRGITIGAMILVNDPGDGPAAYWPLRHAHWNGWTPTDLIFPFFVFIVGVAMAFSFPSRLNRGQTRLELLTHVCLRGFALFAMGMFLNGFSTHYQLEHWRIYGVLQRIALCYVVTSVLELWTGWRTQLAVLLACLAGYWVLMRYVPVPGFGVPTHQIPLLDPDRNLVAWLDRKLLAGHLYEGTRDPEGLLSTIPAVASCLAGLLTGKWLRTGNSPERKALGMAVAGVIVAGLGRTLDLWLPINKKLWTSSYVLFTAGLALVILAVCYWLVDAKRRRGRWTEPILVLGKNAIAAYFFSELLASVLYAISVPGASGGKVSLQQYIYSRCFLHLSSPANASLAYALVYVAICWAVMAALYRKRIFLKI